jgi:hypothetical protein
MELSGEMQPQEQLVLEDLDPRRAPPRELRDLFKGHSRTIVSPDHLAQIADSSLLREPEWVLRKCISEDLMQDLFHEFQIANPVGDHLMSGKIKSQMRAASIYESTVIPGRESF